MNARRLKEAAGPGLHTTHPSIGWSFFPILNSQRFMNSGLPSISGARSCVGDASTALAVDGEK
jgi:hypothetical protein